MFFGNPIAVKDGSMVYVPCSKRKVVPKKEVTEMVYLDLGAK